MSDQILQLLRDKMNKTLEALTTEFSGLRAGRASSALLDCVRVDAYGNVMPLNQVGTVSVADARLLLVQVWDRSLVKPTEKAIRESGLGLNPMVEGQTIRVPLPPLSQDRREELVKVAHKYAEQGRVSIRNTRREGMDSLKKMEKSSLSEDDKHRISDKIQNITDEYIKKIDEVLASKEKDILQI